MSVKLSIKKVFKQLLRSSASSFPPPPAASSFIKPLSFELTIAPLKRSQFGKVSKFSFVVGKSRHIIR